MQLCKLSLGVKIVAIERAGPEMGAWYLQQGIESWRPLSGGKRGCSWIVAVCLLSSQQ
jgi:hypothetical protein